MEIKDIFRANTRCLAYACERMNVPYNIVDEFGNFIEIFVNGKRYYFISTRTPLNSESIAAICLNKVNTAKALHGDFPMPKTFGYYDPKGEGENANYVSFKTYDEIVDDIRQKFGKKTVVIKMNAGARGINVFKCDSKRAVRSAVKTIFNQKHRKYDFSLLAQEYIDIKNEYRVIIVNSKVHLVYEKITDNKIMNLSPLHNENSRTEIVEDKEILEEINKIVSASEVIHDNFIWNGLDIVRDINGKWFLIELNSHPGFTAFARDNGDEPIIKVYEKVLEYIFEKNK